MPVLPPDLLELARKLRSSVRPAPAPDNPSRPIGGQHVVPRGVVVVVTLVLTAGVVLDLGSQYFVPGHTANPLIIGPLLALLGAIITGTRGPRPDATDDDDTEDKPRGRHRGEGQ